MRQAVSGAPPTACRKSSFRYASSSRARGHARRGAAITDRPPYQRARLGAGYVPQGREIFPARTCSWAPGKSACRPARRSTINPAIAHGLAAHVGSNEVGRLADLVLWKPAFFGVKPGLVVKDGAIAWAAMGDPNASIPTPQPVRGRPMFAAYGRAVAATALTFVSAAAPCCEAPSRSADWPASTSASRQA
jgi:hypothetical protein